MNRFINKILIITIISLITFSCKDDDATPVAGIEIDKTELNLYDAGGEEEISVKANGEWIAKSDASWCMVSPANGNGDAVCRVVVDQSTRYDERTAKITFICGSDYKEVKVTQLGYAPVIKVITEEASLPYYTDEEKAYFDVEVMANVPYEAVIEDAEATDKWLSTDKDYKYEYAPSLTKPETQTFRFHYDINSSTENRTLTISFKEKKEGGIVSTYKVTQEHMERIIPSRRGDSLTVVTLARLMGLYGTYWDTSRPITHWDNIETEEVQYEYVDEVAGIRKDSIEERIVGISFFMFDTDRSIPFQIVNLKELRTLEIKANSNSYLRSIKLGNEITKLDKLQSLSLYAYGISELPAPEDWANMSNLEELNLYGNSFIELGAPNKPGSLLWSLSGLSNGRVITKQDGTSMTVTRNKSLKYLELGGNRKKDSMDDMTDIPLGVNWKTDLGLTGEVDESLFTMFPDLEHLGIGYNYLYGELPEIEGNVLPKLRSFRISLNKFSGNLPNWVLKHANRNCWDPDIRVFNQTGKPPKEANSETVGFTNLKDFDYNAPCPEETEEAVTTALYLPELNDYEKTKGAPLAGYWRYYERFNLWKNHEN